MGARKLNKFLLFVASLTVARAYCPACSVGQQVLPGTTLSVKLPPDWSIGPENPHGGNNAVHLNYKGDPGFAIYVAQNTNAVTAAMGLPFECDFMFGAFASIKNAQGEAISVAELRPDYFPTDFYSWVLKPKPVEKGAMVVGCLFLGNTSLGVQIWPEPKPMDSWKVSKMLQEIAEAGRAKSSLVYSPGDVALSLDRVKVSLTDGIWGTGALKMPNAENQLDLLVRTGGEAEMKLMPMPQTGSCSAEMKQFEDLKTPIAGLGPGAIKRKPLYITSNWYPVVVESVPAKKALDEVLIMSCRQLTATTLLMMNIAYGRKEVSEKDAPIVAKTLDQIADAILHGPKGDGVIYLPPMLTPTQQSTKPQ